MSTPALSTPAQFSRLSTSAMSTPAIHPCDTLPFVHSCNFSPHGRLANKIWDNRWRRSRVIVLANVNSRSRSLCTIAVRCFLFIVLSIAQLNDSDYANDFAIKVLECRNDLVTVWWGKICGCCRHILDGAIVEYWILKCSQIWDFCPSRAKQ